MSRIAQISQVKQISIAGFLQANNVLPAKEIRDELYYLSPFRKENTPSFTVNTAKNVWFDHGAGTDHKGGDILDLAMELLQVDMNTALAMLSQVLVNPHVTVNQLEAKCTVKPKLKKSTLSVVKVEELNDNILLNYLRSRRVKLEYVLGSMRTLQHLKQVFYVVDGRSKEYFALGWLNSAGGYELSSKNFTGFIGEKKSYTFLKGTKPGIAIFESFIDYFSALTHFERSSLGYDILILNSTRLVRHTLEVVKDQPHLHFFLDNDEAGMAAVMYFKKTFKTTPFTDHSHLYDGYKDFNDLLTKTKPKKALPVKKDANSEISQKARWWLWVVFLETDEFTGRNKTRTFYSFNSQKEGFDFLLYLRAFKLRDVKLSRLCERTKGREFKILEEAWH